MRAIICVEDQLIVIHFILDKFNLNVNDLTIIKKKKKFKMAYHIDSKI